MAVMNKKVAIVDVREDIRSGREPFSKIMQAALELEDDQDLLLIAPFEPAPLFAVLGQRGFSHESNVLANGDYEVRFFRGSPSESANDESPARPAGGTAEPCVESELEVDARGLEPPQPLVKILEALATLPQGKSLRAHTDRRPMHLYAQLESRGFIAETKEQDDGSFITYVSRR
jgi:uncharacterized protein (DUF2249 family)